MATAAILARIGELKAKLDITKEPGQKAAAVLDKLTAIVNNPASSDDAVVDGLTTELKGSIEAVVAAAAAPAGVISVPPGGMGSGAAMDAAGEEAKAKAAAAAAAEAEVAAKAAADAAKAAEAEAAAKAAADAAKVAEAEVAAKAAADAAKVAEAEVAAKAAAAEAAKAAAAEAAAPSGEANPLGVGLGNGGLSTAESALGLGPGARPETLAERGAREADEAAADAGIEQEQGGKRKTRHQTPKRRRSAKSKGRKKLSKKKTGSRK